MYGVKYIDLVSLVPFSGDVDSYSSLASYSCADAQRMPISSADPSLSLAFYCYTHDDFTRLIARVQHVASDADQMLFSVVKESLQMFDSAAGTAPLAHM